MNKNQIKGRANQAKGKVKEVSGKIFHDKQLEKKGQAQKVVGKVQAGYGDFQDELQDLEQESEIHHKDD